MIGTTVSHYTILAPLGRGAMGEVYRARDTRLGREVALKFLSEELSRDGHAVERFQREARAASGLNHPHVCAVYDIGEHAARRFIVMELLDGTTLHEHIGGRALPVDRILEIGVQIADALAATHALGIVHRDIKPANVFITARGAAKLLDFGLARQVQLPTDAASTAPTLEAQTDHRVVMGTSAYMSPEQVRGEPLDARTDLFSLGAVLYEMATGRQAFSGLTAGTVHDAVLNRAPADAARLNPLLPPRFLEIVDRALEKDRTLRYQNAADLRADLQRVRRDLESAPAAGPPTAAARAAPPLWWRRRAVLVSGVVAILLVVAGLVRSSWLPWKARAIDSVAVLPFVNASGRPDTDYLSDGITESLIRDLSEVPSLRVVSRSRVFRYKGPEVDPQKAGQELGVRAVLSGRLLQRDRRLRRNAAVGRRVQEPDDQRLRAAELPFAGDLAAAAAAPHLRAAAAIDDAAHREQRCLPAVPAGSLPVVQAQPRGRARGDRLSDAGGREGSQLRPRLGGAR
jgi:TolB-like protein/tRNA A-37 threonylcarbamoyl transferase component Bud32